MEAPGYNTYVSFDYQTPVSKTKVKDKHRGRLKDNFYFLPPVKWCVGGAFNAHFQDLRVKTSVAKR